MPRTDRATRRIAATPERVYAALVDEAALVEWLPPQGMTGRFERFDARPGGSYRLVLTYDDPTAAVGGGGGGGKATTGEDIVEARFLELVPAERVVQAVVFESPDPAFAGTMTMTWTLSHHDDDGTIVTITADGVPDGISADDHATGMASSLANLARYLDADAGFVRS